ncbi:hypothetical protein [Embleya sp. AB8]|uniref:hypothetical protein n=1 Tax=Embleya sp. AB8 TaxID=3156304 RepID=UPI003C771C25
MITIICFAVGLLLLVVGITVKLGKRGSGRTTNHEGQLIERDRTSRAQASGGIFGVHANHSMFPGVQENNKHFS